MMETVFGAGAQSDTKDQERSSTFEDGAGKEKTSPEQNQMTEPVFGAAGQGGTPEQSEPSTSLETMYDGAWQQGSKGQENQKPAVDGEVEKHQTPQNQSSMITTGDENGNQQDQQGGEMGKKTTRKPDSKDKKQKSEPGKADGDEKGQSDIKDNRSHVPASADAGTFYMKSQNDQNYVEPSKMKTRSHAQRYHNIKIPLRE